MLRESGLEPRAEALELVVDRGVPQPTQDGKAGSGRERVARQRARLVDGSARSELLHDLGAPAEGGERQAAADDLAEHRQVRQHAEALLRTAARHPEARDHLVEDEQRAGRIAKLPQRLEKAGVRRDDAHVPGDRLDDDGRQALAVPHHGVRRSVDVVVRAYDRVGGDRGRNTGRGRDGKRCEPGARAREQRIDVTVVAARELEDAITLREAAREPQRAHRGLRAGRDEPNPLDRRHCVDDLLRELDLGLGRRAERRAALRSGTDRLDGLGIGMAEDERPPREHPVEVPAAVGVDEIRTLAAGGEERLLETDGAHRPHRRVDSAGDELERAAIEIAARA